MKFAEINKRYTEVVAEYIAKGYTINTSTMGGHQGEIAKIDLTDGTDIIRIEINDFTERRKSYFDSAEGIEIIVGKNTDKVKPNSNDTWSTIWSSHLEIIYQERFYQIGSRHRSVFYGSKEEEERAYRKRIERYSSNGGRIDLTEKYLELGKKYIKRTLGKQKVSTADIKVYMSNGNYYVSYKCNDYRLH